MLCSNTDDARPKGGTAGPRCLRRVHQGSRKRFECTRRVANPQTRDTGRGMNAVSPNPADRVQTLTGGLVLRDECHTVQQCSMLGTPKHIAAETRAVTPRRRAPKHSCVCTCPIPGGYETSIPLDSPYQTSSAVLCSAPLRTLALRQSWAACGRSMPAGFEERCVPDSPAPTHKLERHGWVIY